MSYQNLNNEPKMSIADASSFLNITAQAVHKQIKAKNIQCPKLGKKSYINFQIAHQLFGITFNSPKIIVSQIVKGGTGKTTAIDAIASCANSFGARVLKIDIDPQGNLSDASGINFEQQPVIIDVVRKEATIEDCIVKLSPGLDIIGSRVENVILDNELITKRLPLDRFFRDLIKPIYKNYDFIFIDCPPTMGVMVTAATLASDLVVSPLNPDKFSIKGLDILSQEITNLNENYHRNLQYRVFLNKYSGKTLLSEKAVVTLLTDPKLEGKVMSTTIPFSQEIPNCYDRGFNVFATVKKSIVRSDFISLTRDLLEITLESKSNTSSDFVESVEIA